ncbi:MAG: lipoyl synthase [Acidimicrobiales bacterium]|nr:lipoyl synthase [Acidimicrobiales bacterium]
MTDLPPLRIRWLGTVDYREAHAIQRALFECRTSDWLLLLEHPHVFTLGARGDRAHILVDPAEVGADVVTVDRGGDVTYHGPGQLVGYPILTVPGKRGGGMADTVAYVRGLEQLLIDTLADLGLDDVGRLADYPGVWVEPGGTNPRKIAAIGVRLSRGRSMHGFALNVAPDMRYFSHIVPCGINDKAVTSLAAEGIEVTMAEVTRVLIARARARWAPPESNRLVDEAFVVTGAAGDVATSSVALEVRERGTSAARAVRLAQAGGEPGLAIEERKPAWLRAQLQTTRSFAVVRRAISRHRLVTVCEEAGCPNIFECWADGTATFMINGDRCTRACGFCLVDTRRPLPVDEHEPQRVAAAVEELGLDFAVITAVARDDLPDGGANGFASTVAAIRARTPAVKIEVLIPDCKGDPGALETIFAARPDVLNHNIETVARLQRAVRPNAGYARSLAVLACAHRAGLVTKSGLIVGLGETFDEVVGALADLKGVGTDIVTIGQYLRPTVRHLPVARWWTPEEFEELRRIGEEELGIGHVEASPLTRSSYHAKRAADLDSRRVEHQTVDI